MEYVEGTILALVQLVACTVTLLKSFSNRDNLGDIIQKYIQKGLGGT